MVIFSRGRASALQTDALAKQTAVMEVTRLGCKNAAAPVPNHASSRPVQTGRSSKRHDKGAHQKRNTDVSRRDALAVEKGHDTNSGYCGLQVSFKHNHMEEWEQHKKLRQTKGLRPIYTNIRWVAAVTWGHCCVFHLSASQRFSCRH